MTAQCKDKAKQAPLTPARIVFSRFLLDGPNLRAHVRLPEPKGRTYAELDLLFEHKVSARKFASTHIDQFAHVDGGRDVRDEKAEYDVPVHMH